MNVYFYSDNGTQKGPVTYEDLKKARIGKETLIWRDGFEDWQEAGNVSELSSLFTEAAIISEGVKQSECTPTRTELQTENEKQKLDNTKMFTNVFLFRGRARRSEFLVAYAVYFLAIMLSSAILELEADSVILSFICIVLIIGGLWLFLSEGTRRCHDLGHSGFWMLIPYYIFWMLFQDSKVGSNEYGNNPKGENFKRLN